MYVIVCVCELFRGRVVCALKKFFTMLLLVLVHCQTLLVLPRPRTRLHAHVEIKDMFLEAE